MGQVVGPCDCCVEEICGNCSADPCIGTGLPECYELVVAGVTNNECGLCDEYNGTFILRAVDPALPGDRCSWETEELASCGGNVRYRLHVSNAVGADQISLVAHGFFDQSWIGDIPYGNCCVPIDLEFQSPRSNCNDWPATLTIEPIDCP